MRGVQVVEFGRRHKQTSMQTNVHIRQWAGKQVNLQTVSGAMHTCSLPFKTADAKTQVWAAIKLAKYSVYLDSHH